MEAPCTLFEFFSFQFKDVLYKYRKQTGVDNSPRRVYSSASYFQTPSAVWVTASSCGKVSKTGGTGKSQSEYHPLRGSIYWRILLSSPQQEAHVVLSANWDWGLTPLCGVQCRCSGEGKLSQAWPAICHIHVEVSISDQAWGGRRLSLIWKLRKPRAQSQVQMEGGHYHEWLIFYHQTFGILFNKHLKQLYARCCSKDFTNSNSFNPHSLWGKYYYWICVTDEQIETHRA